MQVTMPVIGLLLLIIVIMMRTRHKGDGLTLVEFLLCTAFGFLLAGSSFAPVVTNLLTAVTGTIGR